MLVVNGDGEVLVPFSDAICRRVSVADRVIEIDPPEGLIELNRPVRR
jgi:16S rRNA processing protein RimM